MVRSVVSSKSGQYLLDRRVKNQEWKMAPFEESIILRFGEEGVSDDRRAVVYSIKTVQ